MNMTPASRRFAATVASLGGTDPRSAYDPAVVFMPREQHNVSVDRRHDICLQRITVTNFSGDVVLQEDGDSMQRSTSACLSSLFVQSSRLLQSTRARLDNGTQIRALTIDLLYASKIRLYPSTQCSMQWLDGCQADEGYLPEQGRRW